MSSHTSDALSDCSAATKPRSSHGRNVFGRSAFIRLALLGKDDALTAELDRIRTAPKRPSRS